MRKSLITSYLKFAVVFIGFLAGAMLSGMPVKKEISEDWKFRQARLENWHPATVPGVVHTDLLTNGLIADPFFRLNERDVQWVDKEDWVYETVFTVSDTTVTKKNIRLFFEGLDTYADVHLNGKKILEANNMFREWRIDVKDTIKEGKNKLTVYFHSPIKIDMPKWEALPFQYRAGNDQSENGGLFNRKLSVFARKAGYHYGWDWGPRLVTSGIWRPVWLESWNDARIENVHIMQHDVTAASAKIKAIVEVSADSDIPDATVTIEASGKQNEISDDSATESNDYYTTSVQTNLRQGLNKVTVEFTMQNPKLWWSNGLGEAHLYDFRTNLSVNGSVIDLKPEKIGIRSLRVVNKPDNAGSSFYFELNGVPVFAKGANYIPCDSFLPRVTRDIYEKTILDAVNANMNMLRVWGGGIYENDIFYDLCDQYGIMVWQDFMFACSAYPAEGELLDNIRQEAIDNARRLRNHASLALWCGNNECIDAWFNWGWKNSYEKQNPAFAETIWNQMESQYFETLPQVIAEHDPDRFYWPSSPFSDKSGKRSSNSGDMHFWEVWHGRRAISEYNKQKSRFFSEYGFQSFPEFESVKMYAPNPEDWDISSEVMMAHQRAGNLGNGLIEDYLLKEYRKPKDFQSFLYMNSILQGDAIKTAIEAHRREMPFCMGSLYWQHNDCWPVASWSSRDYYGRWKAQHYFARKAFRDILVAPFSDDAQLHVHVVSDRLNAFAAELSVEVITLDGIIVNSYIRDIMIPANTSTRLFSEDLETLLKGKEKNEVLVHVTVSENDGNKYDNIHFLVKQKDIDYPKVNIGKVITPVPNGFKITLSSDKFARGVFMSLNGHDNFFQDNYFDILPGKAVSTTIYSDLPFESFVREFTVISLPDAY